jgi:hypothetical protein
MARSPSHDEAVTFLNGEISVPAGGFAVPCVPKTWNSHSEQPHPVARV